MRGGESRVRESSGHPRRHIRTLTESRNGRAGSNERGWGYSRRNGSLGDRGRAEETSSLDRSMGSGALVGVKVRTVVRSAGKNRGEGGLAGQQPREAKGSS